MRRSPIRRGARFRFYGLPPTRAGYPDRTIVVLDCSTSGEVSYRIDVDGVPAMPEVVAMRWGEPVLAMPMLHSVPLATAERLLELGVWRLPRPLRAEGVAVMRGAGLRIARLGPDGKPTGDWQALPLAGGKVVLHGVQLNTEGSAFAAAMGQR